MFTFSGEIDDRYLLTIYPAELKRCSQGTDIVCRYAKTDMQNTVFAREASFVLRLYSKFLGTNYLIVKIL